MQYQILNSYAKCERENVKCISNCGCPTGKFEVGFFGEKITSRSLLGVKGGQKHACDNITIRTLCSSTFFLYATFCSMENQRRQRCRNCSTLSLLYGGLVVHGIKNCGHHNHIHMLIVLAPLIRITSPYCCYNCNKSLDNHYSNMTRCRMDLALTMPIIVCNVEQHFIFVYETLMNSLVSGNLVIMS